MVTEWLPQEAARSAWDWCIAMQAQVRGLPVALQLRRQPPAKCRCAGG